MKLLEISHPPVDEQLPTTVGEYIKRYQVRTGAFLPLVFPLPNMITSWEGTPPILYELNAGGTKLATFQGLDLKYANTVDLLNCPMMSYHDVHKHISRCDDIHVYVNATHMLGLFRCVNKPTNIFPTRIRLYDHGNKLDKQATDIFNNIHSKMSDIYQIQEALIDAGYEEQAQP